MSDADPMQTIFDLSEQMLDHVEIMVGLVLAIRIALSSGMDDNKAASEAMLGSLTHHADCLRRDIAAVQAASMERPDDL